MVEAPRPTEFQFTLPRGFAGPDGAVHREGVMRLSTAYDEIAPLKDPRVLPGTVLWLSNGGRSYAPWSSRHRHVIGVEEVRSYFASGHAASIADNPLTRRGIPTAFDLQPIGRVVINYLFGAASAPPDFGPVTDIRPDGDGIAITNARGTRLHAPVDLTFLSTD